jgi:uncharacterized protein DUF3592
MTTVLGIWFALAGVISAIVGLAGKRRIRRLRREGVQAWAVVVPSHPADGEREVALQYTLSDGRVLEKYSAERTAALLPGERVLIWYDPADPQDVLVRGREGRTSDLVFVIAGAALLAAGAVIGIAAP